MAKDLMDDFHFSSEQEFIQALLDEGIVKSSSLKARNGRSISLFSSRSLDEITLYELAIALFPNGYLCNLSSIYYHSLTNQVPNVAYICNETIVSKGRKLPETLSESKIRNAFIKPHRFTSNIVDFQKGEVIIVDRESGSDHGVLAIRKTKMLYPMDTRITCLERALIDAVVTPQYNGGITSLPAYFNAAKKRVKIRNLLDIYRKLRFVYPYAQSIGFFLEKAGMRKRAAEIRSAFPPKQKFFVDHNAKTSWVYDKKWMLHYPRGLFDEY